VGLVRVRLKDNIGRICFNPTTRYFQVVQLRWEVVLSGKKLPGKPKLPKFRRIWLQESERKIWLNTYYLSR